MTPGFPSRAILASLFLATRTDPLTSRISGGTGSSVCFTVTPWWAAPRRQSLRRSGRVPRPLSLSGLYPPFPPRLGVSAHVAVGRARRGRVHDVGQNRHPVCPRKEHGGVVSDRSGGLTKAFARHPPSRRCHHPDRVTNHASRASRSLPARTAVSSPDEERCGMGGEQAVLPARPQAETAAHAVRPFSRAGCDRAQPRNIGINSGR